MSEELIRHFNDRADRQPADSWWRRGYHRQILAIHRHRIPPGETVLEWGCGDGALLGGLAASRAVGLDLSDRMVALARKSQGDTCEFAQGDMQGTRLEGTFDHLISCMVSGYQTDIQAALENARLHAHPRTRLHLTSLNTVWKPILRLCEKIGLISPQPQTNWLSRDDLENLLELAGWEVVLSRTEQLCPLDIPLLSTFCNRFLVRLPVFNWFGLSLMLTARPRTVPVLDGAVSCSVIVPVRNEAGNIRAALERIPVLGRRTEVIFVEGNSKDDTWETVRRECAAYTGPHLVSFCQQPGKGKWDAVFTGFARATGDVLVIQDGDLTAPPEDLPKFFEAVTSGRAEFANGSRLVYPMEQGAMRFLNLLGNKFFAMALTFVLGQPVKDSLCGTKMLLRRDYQRLLLRIRELGDFDPFGDFNLLFGSALLNLRIRDIPVRYRDRTYGETNISRWKHGLMLLRMTCFAAIHIRFFRLRGRAATPGS